MKLQYFFSSVHILFLAQVGNWNYSLARVTGGNHSCSTTGLSWVGSYQTLLTLRESVFLTHTKDLNNCYFPLLLLVCIEGPDIISGSVVVVLPF